MAEKKAIKTVLLGKKRNGMKQYLRCFITDIVQRARETRSRSRLVYESFWAHCACVQHREEKHVFNCWYNSIIIAMYQLQMETKLRAHASLGAEKNKTFSSQFHGLNLDIENAKLLQPTSIRVFFLSFLFDFGFRRWASASLFLMGSRSMRSCVI